MVRKPSIHVTQDGLFESLESIGVQLHTNKRQQLLQSLSKHQVRRALVFAPTVGAAAKVQGKKITDASALKSYAILQDLRNMGHAILRVVKPGQPGWLDVLEASEAADTFVKRFDIDDIRAGHRQYYKIAIEILGANFSVKAVANCFDKICNKFQEDVDLVQCDDLDMVRKIIDKYIILARLPKKVGETMTAHRIHFVRCYNLAKELEVDPLVFLQIQFDQMAWSNSNPTPKQLYGEQAFNRFIANRPNDSNKQTFNTPVTDKQALYAKLLGK